MEHDTDGMVGIVFREDTEQVLAPNRHCKIIEFRDCEESTIEILRSTTHRFQRTPENIEMVHGSTILAFSSGIIVRKSGVPSRLPRSSTLTMYRTSLILCSTLMPTTSRRVFFVCRGEP